MLAAGYSIARHGSVSFRPMITFPALIIDGRFAEALIRRLGLESTCKWREGVAFVIWYFRTFSIYAIICSLRLFDRHLYSYFVTSPLVSYTSDCLTTQIHILNLLLRDRIAVIRRHTTSSINE